MYHRVKMPWLRALAMINLRASQPVDEAVSWPDTTDFIQIERQGRARHRWFAPRAGVFAVIPMSLLTGLALRPHVIGGAAIAIWALITSLSSRIRRGEWADFRLSHKVRTLSDPPELISMRKSRVSS
jgi:hypothetical protein